MPRVRFRPEFVRTSPKEAGSYDHLDAEPFVGVVGSSFYALVTKGNVFRGGSGSRDQCWKRHRKNQWRREARV